MPEDGECVPCYIFFKRIATNNGSYLCDFFSVSQSGKDNVYYVSLQSLCGHTDVLVELAQKVLGSWFVAYTSSELCPELENKLIGTVIEYEAKQRRV